MSPLCPAPGPLLIGFSQTHHEDYRMPPQAADMSVQCRQFWFKISTPGIATTTTITTRIPYHHHDDS